MNMLGFISNVYPEWIGVELFVGAEEPEAAGRGGERDAKTEETGLFLGD